MIQQPMVGGPPVPVDALVLDSQLQPVVGQEVFFELGYQESGTHLDDVFGTTNADGWAQAHVVPGTKSDGFVVLYASIPISSDVTDRDQLNFVVNPAPTETPTPFGTPTETPIGTPTPIPAKLPTPSSALDLLAFLLVGLLLVWRRRRGIDA